MSIAEGERAQRMLQERFKIKTLLVTQESDEEQREDAMLIGDSNSKYEAVVSVLMLREGWDVPQVSTILLLRKFSSPVYGQQVIGRGLRKIIRNREEREILAVVDHPMLEHDWLWKLVAVSKVKQNVTDKDLFDDDDDLPDKLIIQTLVRPEKLIKIPDPEYDVEVDFKKIIDDIPDDTIEEDWVSILEKKIYEREIWAIAKTRINSVEMKSLKDKRVELLDAPDEFDFAMIGKYPRDVLENKFKQELLSVCAGLLRETGYGGNLRGKLYKIMLNHIKIKIFSGKTLCDVDDDDLEFAMISMPDIRKNFTKSIVAGIVGTK
jgi:superfamily II DNA or RNA helicase